MRTVEPTIGCTMPFARSRFRVAWFKVAGFLSLVRVGSLWYLVYREWSHQQSLETLPLILLLLPEGGNSWIRAWSERSWGPQLAWPEA